MSAAEKASRCFLRFFNTVEMFHLFIVIAFGTRLVCPWKTRRIKIGQ